tara:strand:+ start:112 stop:396 length:285 start_codon:yes stop_codon:yes gene_type:complete
MVQEKIFNSIAQVDPIMTNWLVQQLPVVVVMGVMIWWLTKRLEKIETEKNTLAENMIKLTSLYEAKIDKTEILNEKIVDSLSRIIDLIKYGKDA